MEKLPEPYYNLIKHTCILLHVSIKYKGLKLHEVMIKIGHVIKSSLRCRGVQDWPRVAFIPQEAKQCTL